MKGIYKTTIIEILEQDETKAHIQTNYGEITVPTGEVLPVSDKLYYQYAEELHKNDEYREDIRIKQEEIRQRYYAKKIELDQLSSKAWNRKQDIIRELTIKATLEA